MPPRSGRSAVFDALGIAGVSASMDLRPGINVRRLQTLMRDAVARCRLDLSGAVVVTEAASGAYVVTPILAALAGADRVIALARTSRHGTADEVADLTCELARRVGVIERLEVVTRKTRAIVACADIVTNSGNVRPIDRRTVSWMKPTAVIPLMYEAWEFRPSDVDLDACRRRGIAFAGTNLRHPAVYAFSFLGIMGVKLLLDAGVAVQGCSVLLVCDNPFGPSVARGLTNGGARVDLVSGLGEADPRRSYDAVVVGMRPHPRTFLSAETIAQRWPGAVIAQFWGDLDRGEQPARLPLWPPAPPPRGHLGILPSMVGPEPIIRLQSGGLKVAETLLRGTLADPEDLEFLQEIEAEPIHG